MVLNIHSDASYLSEKNARSRVAGHFFLGRKSDPSKPILLNGTIYIMCGILKFVVASAAEAEVGALFLNRKEGRIMRLGLQEMGQPQPATTIHCFNMTATEIENDMIKKQCSRSMEMRFFWVTDQVKNGIMDMTRSSPRRPLFLHVLSFECTSKLCITFLNQFLVYFHVLKMHNTI